LITKIKEINKFTSWTRTHYPWR